MEMSIGFPGGSRVNAEYKGFVIETDQPVHAGGDNSAPAPFDYFLASIGTCAGIYVLEFLTHRGLPTRDVRLTLSTTKHPDTRRVSQVNITVEVPDAFPGKYERAIINAVNLCSVKKHILEPPVFNTSVTRIGVSRSKAAPQTKGRDGSAGRSRHPAGRDGGRICAQARAGDVELV